MQLSREQVVEHLKPPPGITMPPYPRQRDKLYRWSLRVIALGLTGEGAATLLSNHTLVYGAQGWTALGVVMASLSFLVWLTSWRYLVRTLAGLGLVIWPLWHLGGWAFSLAATAIMAAKETHCFHFPAGKIIPWYSLFFGMALLSPLPSDVIGAGWLILAVLWWWLAWDRSHLPLFEIN